jgi:hypothetical protein
MEIQHCLMSEGGEPLVFYDLDEQNRPICDIRRVGLLLAVSRGNIRDFSVNYLGPLKFLKINQLKENGFSKLESVVEKLIEKEKKISKIQAGVCSYPLVLMSFDEEDSLDTLSLMSFGDSIKSKTRTLTLNYLGNIILMDQYAFLRGGFDEEYNQFVRDKTFYMKRVLNERRRS